MSVKGEHEILCCGSRVRISPKGVEVLTEPLVDYCPLHEALYGTKHIDADAVRKSVETKIAKHGLCCGHRHFDSDGIVAYGASEMMRVWLEKGIIDCAIIVCEGAGTVIAAKGSLVQAIGARLTGIIRTSPIQEIIARVEADGGVILDKTSARIDQVEGVKRAFDLGFRRVVVTIAGFQATTISKIRNYEADAGADVLIFSVCNTCVGETGVKHIAKADIACASASKLLRKEIGRRALMQLGMTIPVYALTERGRKHVLAYLTEFKDKLVVFRAKQLPYLAKDKGPRLKG